MKKTEEFGEGIVLVRGWDYTIDDYKDAWHEGKLLTAQIETSNLCDLICVYCFREELGLPAKRRLPGEISVERTIQFVDELAQLEAQTVNIIGAGEPTVDPGFAEILGHIAQHGISPVVFTHGGTLDDRLIRLFQDTGTSVIIKVNSFNPSIQDVLIGREGYTAKRDRGLQLLLGAGFAQPGVDASGRPYQTRLGIDSVICQENIGEIMDIFRYCRTHNIMPLTVFPERVYELGNTETKEYIYIRPCVINVHEKEIHSHY